MEKIQLLVRAGNYFTWDGDPSPRWLSRLKWNWRLFLIQERACGGNAYWSDSHSMHLTCAPWHNIAPASAWAATLWTGSRNWSRKQTDKCQNIIADTNFVKCNRCTPSSLGELRLL